MKTVLEKIKTVDHLPHQKSLKGLIEEEIQKNNFRSLHEIIGYDPGLCAEFLKIANSEAYGYREKINTLQDALLIVDDDLIRLIVRQHPVLPDTGSLDTGVQEEYLKIIRHSIEVRVITEIILNKTDNPFAVKHRMSLLAASILHDLGRIYILIHFPGLYTDYFKEKFKDPVSQKITLPEHALIGSLLCDAWNLPVLIKSFIAFHHMPWNCPDNPGAEILYLADGISATLYEYYYFQKDIYTFDEHLILKPRLLEISEKYNIDIVTLMEIRKAAGREWEKVCYKLNIPGAVNSPA